MATAEHAKLGDEELGESVEAPRAPSGIKAGETQAPPPTTNTSPQTKEPALVQDDPVGGEAEPADDVQAVDSHVYPAGAAAGSFMLYLTIFAFQVVAMGMSDSLIKHKDLAETHCGIWRCKGMGMRDTDKQALCQSSNGMITGAQACYSLVTAFTAMLAFCYLLLACGVITKQVIPYICRLNTWCFILNCTAVGVLASWFYMLHCNYEYERSFVLGIAFVIPVFAAFIDLVHMLVYLICCDVPFGPYIAFILSCGCYGNCCCKEKSDA